MIDFKHITLEHKEWYEKKLAEEGERGCEYSFANLYLWGRQTVAEVAGCAVFFSQFNRKSVYPFPVGNGDKKAALDAIIADAAERGIPCRITGLTEGDKEMLEEFCQGRFRIHSDRDAHDYIYLKDDLALLQGKKYHRKRNHLKRFKDAYPTYTCEVLGDGNTDEANELLKLWYAERAETDPDSDFLMEKCAVAKALRDREALGLAGYLLKTDGKACAIAIGSKISADTFDVHFEKALTRVTGAYTAINQEFAAYISEAFPEVKYLNREEDMGIPGLRRAKTSYYPHHMIEKWWACLPEEGYEY